MNLTNLTVGKLTFSDPTFTTSTLIVHGNTIVHGWLTSWTTWLVGGILLGLIIWNIILSIKLKKFASLGQCEVKNNGS